MRYLTALLMFLGSLSPLNTDAALIKPPASFRVRFETSAGNFTAEIDRSLSPLAADNFYKLVKHGYFDGAMFYRVVPGFVAQFGNPDSSEIKEWVKETVPDEPVKAGNLRGTIAYARDVKDSRGGELYINLKDNSRLDTITFYGVKGFPVIGRVTEGMETVDKLCGKYGDRTMDSLDLMYSDLPSFNNKFPGLDTIKKARVSRGKCKK